MPTSTTRSRGRQPAATDATVRRTSKLHPAILTDITEGFYQCCDRPDIRRSHLFNGRYENIYLNETRILALKPLIEEACGYASEITGVEPLRTGYWFNHMPPNSVTTPHCHDDDDELLSAVFYLQVPQNSGDLIIHSHSEKVVITPEIGLYVFFRPDVVHEVTVNNSRQHRLSLAINFGRQ